MSRRDVDAAASALSRKQHGVWARRQLRDLGTHRSLIGRRINAGLWLELAPNVFADPGAPATWPRQAMAACLFHNAPAAVAGNGALSMHGLAGVRRGPVELLVATSDHRDNPLGRARRTRHLDRVDITRRDNIPVLTLERALIEMAARLGVRELGRLVDEATLDALLDLDRLTARSGALLGRGKPGGSTMKSVLEERLDDAYVPPASELEAVLFEVIASAHLPPPDRQYRPPWWEDRPMTVDAAYPGAKVIIEADGRRWHARVADFEVDRTRDLLAITHGWSSLRPTWRQLTSGAATFVAALSACLGRAG